MIDPAQVKLLEVGGDTIADLMALRSAPTSTDDSDVGGSKLSATPGNHSTLAPSGVPRRVLQCVALHLQATIHPLLIFRPVLSSFFCAFALSA